MRLEGERPGGDGLRERPLGDLVRELVQDGQALFRDELRIARAELRVEAQRAKKGVAALGAGAAVGWAALLLLGMTLVLVGATFMPAWLAALVVTVVYGAAAAALLGHGKKELARTDPARAIEGIREDGRWAKETMRGIKSRRGASA